MKKSFFLSVLFVLLAVSCGQKPEEQVQEFAVKFGDFVNTSRKDSIQKYYPEFLESDSLTTLPIGDIAVHPESTEGEFSVVYSPKTSLTVKIDKDGKILVKASKGLFVFPENQIELVQKEDNWNEDLLDIQKRDIISQTIEKRNSFTSPDLDFFNLHGPVKSMKVSYTGKDNYGYNLSPYGWFLLWEGNYDFNEEGEWTNYKKFDFLKIVRNSNNQIINIYEPPLYDDGTPYDITKYFWDGNHPNRCDGPFDEAKYSYENNVFSKVSFTVSPGDGTGYWNISFTDYQFDDLGNWISCSWSGNYHYYEERSSSKGTVSRQIEYY